MFADKTVIEFSKKYVRLIIRRPHAYWFRKQYSETPIPGFVFLDSEGKVIDTFPLQPAGQTLEKLRVVIQKHAPSPPDATPAPEGEEL